MADVTEPLLLIRVEPGGDDAAVRSRLGGLVKPHRVVPVPRSQPSPLRVQRLWAADNWRGGLGGATVYDELWPAGDLAAALPGEVQADTPVLLCGSGWRWVDPGLARGLLDRHASGSEALRLVFNQAPPGLSPVLLTAGLLREAAASQAWLRSLLAYDAAAPRLDPVGQDPCAPVPPGVRNTARRFIDDTPNGRTLLEHLDGAMPPDADAETLAAAARAAPEAPSRGWLPPQAVVELTVRGTHTGVVAPWASLNLSRADLTDRDADTWALRLAGRPVTLGGVGDPLLHPAFERIAATFKAAASGLMVDTELRAGPADAERLLAAGVDVVQVRLHADTPEVYAAATGVSQAGAFEQVVAGLDLLKASGVGLVPTMTRCVATLPDLEHFFTRNWRYRGHALLQRYPTGGRGGLALAGDLNPIPMERPTPPDPALLPPRLSRCTVRSNGRAMLCHEDWTGRVPLDAACDPAWDASDAPVCRRCLRWLQAQQAS